MAQSKFRFQQKVIDQGLDGASNISSETKGVVRNDEPICPLFSRHDALVKLMCISVSRRCFLQKLYWCCSRNSLASRASRNHISQKTIRRLTGTVLAWRNCDTSFTEKDSCILVILERLQATFERLSSPDLHDRSSASRTSSVISGAIWISHKSSHINRDQLVTHRHL